MKVRKLILLAFVACLSWKADAAKLPVTYQFPDCPTLEECEELALQYVEVEYEALASEKCRASVSAEWEYNTDLLNPDKEEAAQEAAIAYSKFIFDEWNKTIRYINYTGFQNEKLRRQLTFLNIIGTAALNNVDLTRYNQILGNMARVYGTAKICPFDKQNCNLETEGLDLEPDIEDILATSRNSAELAYVWKAWRDASGKPIREMYSEYIDLSNKAAAANGLPNNGDLWLARYEADDFREQVAEVWETVKELYQHLYGYVRFRLNQTYPDDFSGPTDPIPAHLLGNMWSQSWENLYPLMIPFPDHPVFDVTEELQKKFPENITGITALFEEANAFFTGLGLEDMSMSYGEKAMIIRPANVSVVCHASAWDYCDGEDFRIKMCTKVNQEDYSTVHHELGHIQYFIQYKNQSITFRDGSNPGFHEAIGDVLSLSVATPRHMNTLGYLPSGDVTKESAINLLMQKALEKVAFLPFGYLIDAYRWKLFDGSVPKSQMEYEWLRIRNEIQGLVPPVSRSEADFDAGAKYHVPGNTPYIRYFVSFIIQFQIHKHLCIEAEMYDPSKPDDLEYPLYNCDIAGNSEAGAIMKTLLTKGFSENWQDVLEDAIGSRVMDGSAINEYFAPLVAYFKEQQALHNYALEWKMDAFKDKYADEDEIEEVARKYVEETYETQRSEKCRASASAEWEYNTDLLNPDKEEAAQEAAIAYSKFIFEEWNKTIRDIDFTNFKSESLKRQLKFLNVVGTAALNDEDLTKYNQILGNMARVYGTAKICPYNKQDCNLETEGLNLEPEIETIVSTSRDSAELAYVWKAWRDASGKPIREMYQEFIALSNKAAEANGFEDTGDLWLVSYEADDFRDQVAAVWETVKELYQHLYGYVRFKLRQTYPNDFSEANDPIPAHLLGNVWGQSWESLYPLTIPYDSAPGFDVTEKLKQKFPETLAGITALFEEANAFFTELGLEDMSMSYGEKGMIIRPENVSVVCHASAWDFCMNDDFRIKMCTKVNQEDYSTVHHELGHIQYYLQYKHQPITFREGANPGFHEAIGDVLSLSVATPRHMASLGYLPSGELTKESAINLLMQKALEKVAFLPFGYLIDAYRWKLFDGSVPENETEYEWLRIRNEIQGLVPPVSRSEADFDAGAKYHVPGNTPYIRYFVSFIIQFQIHKHLCIQSGMYDPSKPDDLEFPLYNCDIAGNPEAGAIMKNLLTKGFSENWQDVLEDAIGSRVMDGSAINEYFAPLVTYFKEQQAAHNYTLEWKMDAFKDKYGNEPEEEKSDKLSTGLIITGIVQGGAIVVAMGAYVVKTFILKR